MEIIVFDIELIYLEYFYEKKIFMCVFVYIY